MKIIKYLKLLLLFYCPLVFAQEQIKDFELRTMFIASAHILRVKNDNTPKYKVYMFFKESFEILNCSDKLPGTYWMIDHEGGLCKKI